jgi:hypothetical protein
MMSKKSWLKWGLLVGSVAVFQIPFWSCISEALWQTFFLRAVN